MGFLDRISLNLIKNEKDMLSSLLEATEQWHNELTTPLLSILNGEINAAQLSQEKRREVKRIAEKMLNEKVMVNQGNYLENKLEQIDRSIGIPFFSERDELKARIHSYLYSGMYLKKFIYGSFNSSDVLEVQEGINSAKKKWLLFRKKRDSLVKQINTQLAKIGLRANSAPIRV